jgi:hypothetical protein
VHSLELLMAARYAELRPDEHQLDGAWLDTPEGAESDEVDRRIFWLIRHSLRSRAMTNGGWDQLYVDPRDGRYWELTFPHGSLHGGGPRRLAAIGAEMAREKYGVSEPDPT